MSEQVICIVLAGRKKEKSSCTAVEEVAEFHSKIVTLQVTKSGHVKVQMFQTVDQSLTKPGALCCHQLAHMLELSLLFKFKRGEAVTVNGSLIIDKRYLDKVPILVNIN